METIKCIPFEDFLDVLSVVIFFLVLIGAFVQYQIHNHFARKLYSEMLDEVKEDLEKVRKNGSL